MKIALCSTGPELESKVDERFGRAAFFVFYNSETKELTAIENSARTASGGAGALAVQQIVDNDAVIVIAPELGPQALDALKQFRIPAYKQGSVKTVQEAITAWENETLTVIKDPGIQGLHKA